jgi:DNA-binding MarR family transcriptional regulator
MRAHARNRYGAPVLDPDPGVAAWSAFLRAHHGAVRAIENDLAREGVLPLGWYDVLLELHAAPSRRLRMRELADRVVLSRTRVSRIVDELVGAGYVERRPDPDDGRASLAVLTDEGAAARKLAAPRYLAAIEHRFSSLLEPEELQVLTTALLRVAEQHERTPDEAPQPERSVEA